ncbi:Putative C2 domain, MUN domain, mammalian uncoordinated 13, domain 2, C2 domain superfamily [Septoria linicola]|uniref:C2 domain, MUN domain, mammalian uncoordinated 13, domain 2, C2 domain superfamily n=1 Tax=Septoria linicola TaxID=215465 RepID=A0A9Q9AQS5_9PEZI|nr:Putative C2 domain, MUN domain, mammalian uncoordinated 13, domain 2, C2 domain superfamily [Septoria linicola]
MERSSCSSVNSRRTNSHAARETLRRNMSGNHTKQHHRPAHVSQQDAYLYALRAAYLVYLLQPRQKRVQHVANTSKPIQRSSTSINDMVKDFSLIRDSKSTKFPHGFMAALDKRLSGVLTGTEKLPEFHNGDIKRTFGVFLNEFKNPTFRKSMEKDRKVEDLLLIFFSKATATLQMGKAPDDDGWKLMVDRHVALFVRLISSTLNNNDWTRDRPELTSRLKSLEQKLLQHDQDLADERQRNGGQGGTSVEIEVPRSYEVKDMPLVIRVCRIFSKPTVQAQNDINAHKDHWTEKEALRDLKEYQTHMSLSTSVTLSKDDFDLDEAYETWRKGEFTDLSQMMLALLQSNPALAKGSSGGLPQYKAPSNAQGDSNYSELSKSLSKQGGESDSAHVLDQPVDMSGLNLGDSSPSRTGSVDATQAHFTFIPPDARAYYRQTLKAALTADLEDEELQTNGEGTTLISPQTQELLNDIAHRWRVPAFTRLVLFLDVIKEKYQNQAISLVILDAAFQLVKSPPVEAKKGKNQSAQADFYDRSKWTLPDFATIRSLLGGLQDALLREFYEVFQHVYESKPAQFSSVMTVLEEHIWSDPSFTRNEEEMAAFANMMSEQLRAKARDQYHDLLAKHVPDDSANWEFYNVIQLGTSVTAMCNKIQKRFRKMPDVMGVKPLPILVEEILPSFSSDAKELVARIMEVTKARGEEVPVQDGFELYAAMVEIRGVYSQALPGRAFTFDIEHHLQDFVWRWIHLTDAKLLDWIEGAVTHDEFKVRQEPGAQARGEQPTDDERHSQSAIDVYRIFNQSIEQILKLEWDNDLQYAKFMTAISKSIGKGVARYCELLEAKFTKEMDRQTPEQEARAQQTQRERWMTAARDAWATGSLSQKIEPFNFWPESFVKINDIEYATLQLDQVEHEMNVDACVQAIQKYEPPPPTNVRKRGGNKCMFTIKIIEAEDLKAGDMNGLSDPYVVLGDEYQKRLAKTRTVYQSLNPRWDETIDILTSGPLNVIATVWDWDALGDHDCLGRTSLKLDPNHFNDYLPREYWLDLDTQGRVLVRVTMEGERDDIQFYFGKAFRTLKRTERDMTRRITDKLFAYIQQCLSRRTLRGLTSTSTSAAIAGVSMNTMRGYFSRVSNQVQGRPVSIVATPPPQAPSGSALVEQANNALKPLLQYFDDNFAIMKQTLTDSSMTMVMTRLWKEVLVQIEGLLVPPLSDKPSAQKPLTQAEVDVVYKWLQILFEFFNAMDPESGIADGVPMDVLKSPKYHDLQNLAFFYFESTDNLIRTSEAMASATAARQQEQAARLNRMSAPAGFLSPALGGTRRSKSILQSRNLGTMRKAKEEKRKEAQADPNDDMILRILRMRPEAERYLKDRSRQKERLAAAAAAEAIVRQSLQSSRAGGHAHSQSLGGAQRGGMQRGGIARQWGTIRE